MCGMSDMRSIRDAIAMGDLHAKLARDVFIHRIRKYLGAFNLRLNGDVDAVVFTGGVGENDSELRDQVGGELCLPARDGTCRQGR